VSLVTEGVLDRDSTANEDRIVKVLVTGSILVTGRFPKTTVVSWVVGGSLDRDAGVVVCAFVALETEEDGSRMTEVIVVNPDEEYALGGWSVMVNGIREREFGATTVGTCTTVVRAAVTEIPLSVAAVIVEDVDADVCGTSTESDRRTVDDVNVESARWNSMAPGGDDLGPNTAAEHVPFVWRAATCDSECMLLSTKEA